MFRKSLMKVIHVLSVFLFLSLFLSSCASRGFKLSQQMPGMDNKLNPIQGVAGSSLKYKVAADGRVLLDEEGSSSKRELSSEKSTNDNYNLWIQEERSFVESTLDPENGAILLN